MKKGITICLLLIIGSIQGMAQQKLKFDRPRFAVSATASVLVLPMSAFIDVNEGTAVVDGNLIPSDPKYQVRDTTGYIFGLYAHGVFILPLYQKQNWSIGIEANAGLGKHTSLRAAEGLHSVVLDFPQFMYYRNHASSVDYAVLAGYKYTLGPLPLHMLLVGFELHRDNDHIIRIYGSVLSNKYYRYYTHGVIEEALRSREVGATYVTFF